MWWTRGWITNWVKWETAPGHQKFQVGILTSFSNSINSKSTKVGSLGANKRFLALGCSNRLIPPWLDQFSEGFRIDNVMMIQ